MNSSTSHIRPPRAWIPWAVFALGPSLIIVTFAIAYVCLTDVQARRSSTGPFLGFPASVPLFWGAFICCTISTMFTCHPFWLRCLLALVGVVIFGITVVIYFALLWVLRPPMVNVCDDVLRPKTSRSPCASPRTFNYEENGYNSS
jgi:hypothetical protein